MKTKKIVSEFKEFAFKGNVLDMAVGVMIGGAFGKIVTSLVNDLFMPLLTRITGQVNMSGLFLALDGGQYTSAEAAKAAGVSTLNYGAFLQSVIDFLLIAICVFLMVRLMGKIKLGEFKRTPPAPPARLCPYCLMDVKQGASRCPHCTAEIEV